MTTENLLIVNVMLIMIHEWLANRYQQWINRTLREDIERLNREINDLHAHIDNIHTHTKIAMDGLVKTLKDTTNAK